MCVHPDLAQEVHQIVDGICPHDRGTTLWTDVGLEARSLSWRGLQPGACFLSRPCRA
jgi:hypothetical protein